MPSRTKRVFFDDFVFVVDENVYEPAEDSFLFAENLDVKEGERVLDMGTGCGILGIIAAEKASEVVAVDVNPYAVHCAKQNAELNNARSKMAFVQSDLFTSISKKAKFDVILFNAPYLPADESETSSWIGRAWFGGATGRQVIDHFISEVPKHLKRTGRILLMQSTLAGIDETLSKFAKCHLNARAMAIRAFPFFETVALLKVRHS
ncbi:MAG TPA: HemK2/MTQ2 family protein methyltransferase [Candidatus Bathyarchaeia archaeon]|nr:HemK2/MTQ2 family protein methyltransferase [Candidatus Bathyarchaeia archaeon]